MLANGSPGAGAYNTQIKPAKLRKLPLLACRFCFVLNSVYLKHNSLKYFCKVRRLWLFDFGCLGTL
jgi:hypothetical protein